MASADRVTGTGVTGAEGEASDLASIREQTRETLELVRALVALMLPKEGGREGPTLEELISAMVAQQRDTLVLLRMIQQGIHTLLDRSGADGGPPSGQGGLNGHAGARGSPRA
jgi:hypothetical protein